MATSAAAVARISLVKKPVPQAAARRSPLRSKALRKAPEAPPAKPFIKWVGGKGRLLPQLTPLLPEGVERMRHVEPFVGGGAFFFAQRPQRALLCDVNGKLVRTYQAIREDVEGVLEALEPLAAVHTKEKFYERRSEYNTGRHSNAEHAALFIYLNRTCFNGLHRVNRKGEFNVPFGRYTNPKISDPVGLRAASAALRRSTIVRDGFEGLLRRAKPGDFVYLDPPYEPVSETASFTSYATGGFSQDDQRRLRDVFAELDRRGCKLMLSNSDVPFIRGLYAKWNIDVVYAGRAINSNGSKRGKVPEVVVRNY